MVDGSLSGSLVRLRADLVVIGQVRGSSVAGPKRAERESGVQGRAGEEDPRCRSGDVQVCVRVWC